jgi:hypothetical protein
VSKANLHQVSQGRNEDQTMSARSEGDSKEARRKPGMMNQPDTNRSPGEPI